MVAESVALPRAPDAVTATVIAGEIAMQMQMQIP
jgi:hypothetical protein